jgi:hypothetical protein
MIRGRFFTITYFLAISLCIIFSASLAYAYSGAQAVCLTAEPAPKIDGKIEKGEWGEEGLYLSKAVCLKGESKYNGFGNVYTPDKITDENDISGTIYCLWDDKNLYLAAKITDDDLFFEKGGGWDNDCCEIRFTPDGSAVVGLWITASLSNGGPGWYRKNDLNGAEATEETPLIQATIGENGYEWEVAIPLDHEAIAGLNPSANGVVGYTVSIGDHDAGGDEYSMPAWSLKPDEWSWDAAFWGEILFSPETGVSPQGKLASSWGAIKTE